MSTTSAMAKFESVRFSPYTQRAMLLTRKYSHRRAASAGRTLAKSDAAKTRTGSFLTQLPLPSVLGRLTGALGSSSESRPTQRGLFVETSSSVTWEVGRLVGLGLNLSQPATRSGAVKSAAILNTDL